MPGNRKTPVTNIKKRMTASPQARLSTKRVKKTISNADESYIQDRTGATVNTATQPGKSGTSNEAIITLLQKLDESNKILSSRMDKMERRSSCNSTPVIPQSHSHETHHSATPLPHNGFKGASNFSEHSAVKGSEHTQQYPAGPFTIAQLPPHTAANQVPAFTYSNRRDAIIPGLDVLRQIPTVTDSVNNILSTYEQRGR